MRSVGVNQVPVTMIVDHQRAFAFVYRWGLSWLRKFSYSCSHSERRGTSVLESRNPAYYGCWIIVAYIFAGPVSGKTTYA